jgi:hypothetical protein
MLRVERSSRRTPGRFSRREITRLTPDAVELAVHGPSQLAKVG